MKKFVQIENKKAHWIFEAAEKPEFAPNIVLVEITGQDHVCEGWDYDGGVFTAPVIVVPEPIDPIIPQPTNAEIQENQIVLMDVIATMYEEMLAKGLV